jgi:hypothetical protein
VRGNAEVLVTLQPQGLPGLGSQAVRHHGRTSRRLLLDQLDLDPAVVLGCLAEQVNRYTRINGSMSVDELLRPPLEEAGVPRFAVEIRRHTFR